MHARLNDTRIVEYHQGILWQMQWQIEEAVFANLAVTIDQQLGMVTLSQWVLGDAFVGQLIVIVADMYVFRIHHRSVSAVLVLQEPLMCKAVIHQQCEYRQPHADE